MEAPNWEGVLAGFVAFFVVWWLFLQPTFTNRKSDIGASGVCPSATPIPMATWDCHVAADERK
jgi:hypothetical protein